MGDIWLLIVLEFEFHSVEVNIGTFPQCFDGKIRHCICRLHPASMVFGNTWSISAHVLAFYLSEFPCKRKSSSQFSYFEQCKMISVGERQSANANGRLGGKLADNRLTSTTDAILANYKHQKMYQGHKILERSAPKVSLMRDLNPRYLWNCN